MKKFLVLVLALVLLSKFSFVALASGGSNTGGGSVQVKVDTIKVDKCYTNATNTLGGQMLLKASSSDPNARIYAYTPDGTFIIEVQNGGGGRYGGTVVPYISVNPLYVVFKSTTGGITTAPTGPFQF